MAPSPAASASETSLDDASFDVRSIPFSRRGSWLDLSPVIGVHHIERDVHLVSHTTGMHAILRLIPVRAGAVEAASTTGTPSALRWDSPAGSVEAVFETVDTIRFRGTGLGMRFAEAVDRLTPFTGMYLYVDPIDGAPVFTSYETGRRYRLTALTGRLHVHGAQALGQSDRWVEIGDDADAPWEVVVEEFETARSPYRSPASFDDVREAVRADFDEFLDSVAPWRDSAVPAVASAVYVLWSATVAPGGFLTREGVLMSKHWMDKVWSWDHCFNALALADGQPRLAFDQFMLPFDHQTDTGALPDSITHSEGLFNYVKPPIHGWAFTTLRAALPAALVEPQLPDIYRRLAAWSRFWLDCRRVPGHRLPHYQHGNDSGWDNATTFDRERIVESPDLAAFLLIQLRVLRDLARELTTPESPRYAADAAMWEKAAAEVHDGLAQLWRTDTYVAVGATSGQESKRRSLLTLLPIALGDQLHEDVADALAKSIRSHLTEWGVATEPLDSPDYASDGYWRGPIWAPSTVLVEDGLRRAGHVDLADEVRDRFLRLCEKSGFAENFDAVTGEGLRDRAYTWTASAYLLFAKADVARR